MTAENSHRITLTEHDPEGRNPTITLWRETDLVDGRGARPVVLTLDAVDVTQAILAAAR